MNIMPRTMQEKALATQLSDVQAELANLLPMLIREQEQCRDLTKSLAAFVDERNQLQTERDELLEQLTEYTGRPPLDLEDLYEQVQDVLDTDKVIHSYVDSKPLADAIITIIKEQL